MKSFKQSIWLVLVGGLFLRLALASFGTLTLDQNTFIAWSMRLADVGFGQFYKAWSDYLPGYLYVLWLLAKINSSISVNPVILYKLPAILADVLTSYIIFKIVSKKHAEKWALIASVGYLFNPAVFANSTLWGQVDSLTALFSMLAVYLSGSNIIFSAIALALGTLVKPQSAVTALVILFLMLRDRWSIQKVVGYIVVGAGVFILGFVPYADGTNIVSFILERVSATTNQYPYTSVNAFNFWAVIGMWKKDTEGVISPQSIGYLLTLVSSITFIALSFKNKLYQKPLFEYKLLAVVMLSMFMFFTRMHERHLLPGLAPLTVAVFVSSSSIFAYVVLSFIYLVNLRFAYIWITDDFRYIIPKEAVVLLSGLATASLSLLFVELPLEKVFERIITAGKKFKDDFSFPEIKIEKKNYKLILYAILAFSLIARFLFLESPKEEYFDEVYHAFTARTILHNDPKAWEWWNTPPQGFAYEWTHPPLAKLGMWASMEVFGETALAWRIPQALLGVGIIYIIYLLGKEIFSDELAGLLAAGVAAVEGLLLVMSRIGMNDSYFLFFALITIYLFIKNKNVWSAITLGLALSSKWTTFYIAPILFVSHFVFKKKFSPSYIAFIFIPILVYLASYTFFFSSGHNWEKFIEVQRQMWWYHTNLKATHAYSSQAWSWPFLIRPIWFYTSGRIDGMVANIYAMGNPAVFWIGLVSVVTAGYMTIVNRSKKLGFVVFSYLALFAPWIASPRIMFFYHYLPAVPFLCLATGYVLRKWPKNIAAYFIIATLLFVYFYPHLTGIKVPIWLDNSYYWIDSWR